VSVFVIEDLRDSNKEVLTGGLVVDCIVVFQTGSANQEPASGSKLVFLIEASAVNMSLAMLLSRASLRAKPSIGGKASMRALSSLSSLSPDLVGLLPPVPSYPVIPASDFGPFTEYSVIHTDRSLNLMSDPFQRVMRDLNSLLKYTYNAEKVAIIPGYVYFSSPTLEKQTVSYFAPFTM
jgi:hypothetical protein